MDAHEKYMRLALLLARKGRTSPNPMVGAVLVKNGRIVGKGFHKKAGEPHAEVEAIRDAGGAAKGATLYLNLEPCCHTGKRMPPCTGAIIKAGIRRVFASVRDPNPKVSGKGARLLGEAGIEVKFGVLKEEAERLNEAFFKYMRTGLPFVVMKAAMSFDGKIASRTGDSKWVSSESSRRLAHEMRARHDALMVGANTVLKDNPRLTARIPGARNPLRIIVDGKLRVNANARVFADANFIVATSEGSGAREREALEKRGGRVWALGKDRVDMRLLMKKLGEEGITSALIEGGGGLNAAVLEARVADKFVFFIAPKIIGGREAPSPVGGEGIAEMRDAVGLRFGKIERVGGDVVIEAYPEKRG